MINVISRSHDQNDSNNGDAVLAMSAVVASVANLHLWAGDRESNDRIDKNKEPVSPAV